MQTPLLRSFSLTTPGGRSAAVALERKTVLADAANPLSLQSLTDTFSVNGRKYTSTWDTATKTTTSSTPAGRQSVTTLDGNGRVVRTEAPGLHPVVVTYDKQGRVATITQGGGEETRVVSFEYDKNGRLVSITDPLKRKRASSTTRPAGSASRFCRTAGKSVLPSTRAAT